MPEQVLLWENIINDKVDDLRQDCVQIFNSRAIESKRENYSTGSTYFIKANEKPRTGLEQLALSIFENHTKGQKFDAEISGAEWWSQVIDPWDDIGVHWDRDYGIEIELGKHVYPTFGTVTYLSDKGAPTVVMDKVGTENSLEEFVGTTNKLIVSKPAVGNHIRFLGDLLHAAPGDLLFEEEDGDDEDDDEDEENSEAPDLKTLLEKRMSKRITFLVNIWVDHIPSQAKKCPKNVIAKLQTPLLEKEQISFTKPYEAVSSASSSSSSSNVKKNKKEAKKNEKKTEGNENVFPLKADDLETLVPLKFNNNDTNYDVSLPCLSIARLKELLAQHRNLVVLQYPEEMQINIEYGPDDSESEDDGASSGEEEEDEEESEEEEEEEVPQPVQKKARK